MLPVLDPRRRSGDTDIVRQAGDAHVVFTVWAVAVVRVRGVTGELAQGVGVLGERHAVGLHPLTLTDKREMSTHLAGFHCDLRYLISYHESCSGHWDYVVL